MFVLSEQFYVFLKTSPHSTVEFNSNAVVATFVTAFQCPFRYGIYISAFMMIYNIWMMDMCCLFEHDVCAFFAYL